MCARPTTARKGRGGRGPPMAHQLCACRKLISPPPAPRQWPAAQGCMGVEFSSGRVALDSTDWQWAGTKGKDCPLRWLLLWPGGGRGWERRGELVFRGKTRSPAGPDGVDWPHDPGWPNGKQLGPCCPGQVVHSLRPQSARRFGWSPLAPNSKWPNEE